MNKDINVLALAYMGDAIYELYVRRYLITSGIVKVELLQQKSIEYVSAKKQSEYLKKILENNILTVEEVSLVNRARNHKGNRHPKNTDIITYKYSTGLEAIIGYLYLTNQKERINKIMNFILGE